MQVALMNVTHVLTGSLTESLQDKQTEILQMTVFSATHIVHSYYGKNMIAI